MISLDTLGLKTPRERLNIKTYLKILKIASKERLNITEIACRIEHPRPDTGLKIGFLERRGLIKKVYSGQSRIIVLTDAGKGMFDFTGEY